MKLKESVRQQVSARRDIKTKIALITEAHPTTVDLWVAHNKHRSPLIGYNVLQCIAYELGMRVQELVEDDAPINNIQFSR